MVTGLNLGSLPTDPESERIREALPRDVQQDLIQDVERLEEAFIKMQGDAAGFLEGTGEPPLSLLLNVSPLSQKLAKGQFERARTSFTSASKQVGAAREGLRLVARELAKFLPPEERRRFQ